MKLEQYIKAVCLCLVGLEGFHGTIEFVVNLDEAGMVSNQGANTIKFTICQ